MYSDWTASFVQNPSAVGWVAKVAQPSLGTIFTAMREVAHIPHPLMRITVHSYNGQWRLRFELDRYEQSFKYDESSHSLDDIKAMGISMSEQVLIRFVDMRTQYTEQFLQT